MGSGGRRSASAGFVQTLGPAVGGDPFDLVVGGVLVVHADDARVALDVGGGARPGGDGEDDPLAVDQGGGEVAPGGAVFVQRAQDDPGLRADEGGDLFGGHGNGLTGHG